MRLDRYVANASELSRSQVHRAIKRGEILLNGSEARSNTAVVEGDTVTLHGKPIAPAQHVYIALHKPAGYLCANQDGDHPTVLDLLAGCETAFHPNEPLQIAGRLDLDTTGLVLITTDGQWNHRVTSPNGRCHKLYEVELADPITAQNIQTLEQGVLLRSETQPTRPCRIWQHNDRQVSIELSEGKYHQVKRMFAAVGNKVIRLHRSAIAGIRLDESLPEGQFRALTPAEVAAIQ